MKEENGYQLTITFTQKRKHAMHPALHHVSLPLISIAAVLLAGCGGGTVDEVRLPAADSTSMLPLVEYCGARAPTSADAATNGWSQERPMHASYPIYDSNAVVSAGGNTETSLGPLNMTVALNDYRGVEGSVVRSGASDAAVVMGAQLSPALGRNSVACVSQVSRLRAGTAVWLPGGGPAYSQPQLSWSSYWQAALPMAQLGGYHVDGFEFVSNFTPAGGAVVFSVPKSRYPTVPALSLCYLAPKAGNWDCSVPTVTDAGSTWRLTQNGLKQGVYLLNASSLY